MPAALPTQDELKQELLLTRARQIRARRAGDDLAVEMFGLRIDALLDRSSTGTARCTSRQTAPSALMSWRR